MTTRLLIAFLLLTAGEVEVAPKYFSHTRAVTSVDSTEQPYVAVDEAIWNGSENRLADIRFYGEGREVPYVTVTQGEKNSSSETTARMLNKGVVQGKTEFVVESPMDEVDTLHLDLKTHDFTTHASVSGADELPSGSWMELGTYSLFDFTKEELGRNWTIKLKSPVRYKYLRIRIDDSVLPDDVLSASVADRQTEKARYTAWSLQPEIKQEHGKTLITWAGSEKVPVERVQFIVDAKDVNFSRSATLSCARQDKSAATARDVLRFDRAWSGELTRVNMQRKGRKIEYESLDLTPSMQYCKEYKIEIENGDDAPLRITSVLPQFLERRLYWKASLDPAPMLYYGDKKANSPRYDFARFFDEPDADKAAKAELGPEQSNPQFTARADDRPFTERYPALMWGALLVAVLGLGAWAVKGFKP
jgi:hypothetical protein